MSRFYHRQKITRWNTFLREVIYLDKGIYNKMPRYQFLEMFVQDGIVPFVSSKGYTWSRNEQQIIEQLLTLLFEMKEGKHITISNDQRGYSWIHYERFLETLEMEGWEGFWNVWGGMEDFQDDGYAYRFRFLLENYLWNAIDLERSSVTKELEEEIREQDAVEEGLRKGQISKGKDDPYLQDISHGLGVREKHTY